MIEIINVGGNQDTVIPYAPLELIRVIGLQQTDFGWKPRGEASWAIKDGKITGTGGNGKVGFLATTSEFADFELKADAMIDSATNSESF